CRIAAHSVRTFPGDVAALALRDGREASRIHEQLGVETLEALEPAAHDGRPERVEGFGPRRARAVQDALAAVFSRSGSTRARTQTPDSPSVEALLELDAHYRNLEGQGALPRIVPRRFNPTGSHSLAILHDEVEGFHVHASFSNGALAHKVKRTHDWVVIYRDRDGVTGQHTVVTEQHGPLAGRRVVRGRELETSQYYDASAKQRPREILAQMCS
ncbi:MAG TPA: hypothetical protein VFN67_22190, partial [Polyangiales bacterium]|nr:hypothetical protein [Polyangiales bacterium]